MIGVNLSLKKLFILSLIVIISISTAAAYDFGKIPKEHKNVQAPEDYPEANSLVLFEISEVFVKNNIIEIEYHVRMKVLTEAGIDEIGEQSLSYYDELDKIKGFEAHTITPDGKKYKVEKSSIFEKEVNSWKYLTFSFPRLEPGAIVEYKYQLKSERFRYLRPWYFQNSIYTLESEFTVALSTGFSYDVSFQNIPIQYRTPEVTKRIDPSSTTSIPKKIYVNTWRMTNLPPIKNEPYMSAINDYRSSLRYQLVSYTYSDGTVQYFVKNWQELGDEQEKYLDIHCNNKNDIRKIAEEITESITDPYEKSKALFNYVKNEIASIEEYNNWYFKHDNMSDMVKEKNGSPEEKNLFLTELHKAVGIQSWPVFISTRSNSKINPRYASPQQFNYLLTFVQIGDSWEFLDASSRNSLYGLLPPECLTDIGFLIDGKNSDLVSVTIKPVESFRDDITRIFIADVGTAVCSTQSNFGGYYAAEIAEDYDENTPQDFIDKKYMDRISFSSTVDEYNCISDTSLKFTVDLSYSSNDMTEELDNNLILKPVSYAFVSNPFKSDKRFFPIDFTYPFTYQNTVEYNLNDSDFDFKFPEPVNIDLGVLIFTTSSERIGNKIIFKSKMAISNPLINPKFYSQVKDFFDNIVSVYQDEIIVVRSSAY